MDNQSFITLSKFTVEARKVIGTVNPARLLKDANYSETIFEKVDASDDTDLILLSLQLRQQLGLLEAEASESEKMPEMTLEQVATPPLPAGKYMFGARG
jgi:hypothetical protein